MIVVRDTLALSSSFVLASKLSKKTKNTVTDV